MSQVQREQAEHASSWRPQPLTVDGVATSAYFEHVEPISAGAMDAHWQRITKQELVDRGQEEKMDDGGALDAPITQPNFVAIQEQFDLLDAVLRSDSLN